MFASPYDMHRSYSCLYDVSVFAPERTTTEESHLSKTRSAPEVVLVALDINSTTTSISRQAGAKRSAEPQFAGVEERSNSKKLRKSVCITTAPKRGLRASASCHSLKQDRTFGVVEFTWSRQDTQAVLQITDVYLLKSLLQHCLDRLRECTWNICFRFSDGNAMLQTAASELEVQLNLIDLRLSKKAVSVVQLVTLLVSAFMLLVKADLFKLQKLDARQTHLLVAYQASQSAHPAHIQLELLSCVTPVLAAILQEVTHQTHYLFTSASKLLGLSFSSSKELQNQAEYSLRVPATIQAMAWDFDDTIFLHSIVPGMKVLFQVLDGHGNLPEDFLRAVLAVAVPHRDFLAAIITSMRASGRDVYVTSFGDESWVSRVLQLLFADLNLHENLFCRRNNTSCHEIVDKNVWLTLLQQRSGLGRDQLLLVDDHRRNVLRAKAFGFAAVQVDRDEGLHYGRWTQVISGQVSLVDAQPAYAFEEDECGPSDVFDMLVAKELAFTRGMAEFDVGDEAEELHGRPMSRPEGHPGICAEGETSRNLNDFRTAGPLTLRLPRDKGFHLKQVETKGAVEDAPPRPAGSFVIKTKGWIKRKGFSMLTKLLDRAVRLVHTMMMHTMVD